jgi:predicted NUDIX family phosphoesterase
LDELVFAIPTVELWNLLTYKEQGLIHGNSDVLTRIVHFGQFRRRKELEEDPGFKQIIPYAIISNTDFFYLFKRTSRQREKRLHNQLTLGVGGHMNPGNSKHTEDHYLFDELKREFFEEVKLLNGCLIENIDFIGFINDDSISVGRVHIGLLYHIKVSNKCVSVNETDKMTADWIKKPDLIEFYEGMETWTKIAFDYYINES